MNTPVLLLVYNRAEQTLRVLERLKQLGVTNVFVSADGPKSKSDQNKTGEVKSSVNRYSSIITNTQFLQHNNGCKKGVIAGINWFFDQVEEGIILEDDCLPSNHFFPFANDLLNRYRTERKVWMISGNNPLGTWQAEGGHFFSRIGHVWGWATWKNRWDDFRPELPYIQSFIDDNGFEKAFGPTQLATVRKQLTIKAKSGEIDTWDYQWMAQILTENGLAVVPAVNLVQNIGFETSGTNVQQKPTWVCNETASKALQVSERPMVIDREYEMELELCKRLNSHANKSVFHYSEVGKTSNRVLKVALVNSTDRGGGAEKIALSIHQELLNRGHQSTLFVQEKKSDLETVVAINNGAGLQQILNVKPNVVHIHNLHGTNLNLAEVLTLSREVPVVFTLHDSWLTTGSKNHPFVLNANELSFLDMMEWKNELEQRKAAISQSHIQFTAPSQWLRERFFSTHLIKAQFVPNGIKKVQGAPIESPSKRYVLFVANNAEKNPYKDFKTLKAAWIKANIQLKDRYVDLVCVGAAATSEQFGSGQLFVLPKLDDSEIVGLMKNALFAVQASKHDNAPLTVLEAHSVHKPVLASVVGGIPELLSTTELTYGYQPENALHLEQKLVDAVRTADKGSFTYRSSETQQFSQMLDAYLGLYLEMLDA